MRPGALIITPGDRSDIMLAAALSVQTGTPLAGLLLTGGLDPDPRVIGLCRKALDSGPARCWRSTSRATARPRTWRA